MLKLVLLVCFVVILQVHEGESKHKSNKCKPVPDYLCAIAYEKNNCHGWYRSIRPNHKMYFSRSKRNDAESILVRKDCTLTAYNGKYEGEFIIIKANATEDRKVNLEYSDIPEYKDMNNDIESVKCVCGANQNL